MLNSTSRKYNGIINEKNENTFLKEFLHNNNLRETISENILSNISNYDLSKYHLEKKGGRKCNYNFLLTDGKNSFKLEFKNNSDSLFSLPEIFQSYITSLPNGKEFIKYVYNNYAHKLFKNSSLEEYLKNINKTSKEGIFKDIDTTIINNEFLLNIASDYWNKFFNNEVLEYILNKLTEQTEKYFVLWKDSKINIEKLFSFTFNHYEINGKYLNIYTKDINGIPIYLFKCLFRWKNGNGILGPAIQISVKNISDYYFSNLSIIITKQLTKEHKRKNGIYFTPYNIIRMDYENFTKIFKSYCLY